MLRFKRALHHRRWLASGLVAALALVVLGTATLASGWCRADPIVEIGGEEVQIWAAIPKEYEKNVIGPIKFTLTTPAGVSREVIFTDSGFNDQGEKLIWQNGGSDKLNAYEIGVHVKVEFDSTVNPNKVPLEVEVITSAGTQVYTGKAVGLSISQLIVPKTN